MIGLLLLSLLAQKVDLSADVQASACVNLAPGVYTMVMVVLPPTTGGAGSVQVRCQPQQTVPSGGTSTGPVLIPLTGAIDGANTTFILTMPTGFPTGGPRSLAVFKNGLLLDPTATPYMFFPPGTVTFSAPPAVGALLFALAWP